MLQIHFDRLSRQLQSNLLASEHFSHDCICLDLQLWNDGATLGGILGHIGTGWTNIFLYNSEVSGLSLSHFTPDGRKFLSYCSSFFIFPTIGKMTTHPRNFSWFLAFWCLALSSLLVTLPSSSKSDRVGKMYRPTWTSKFSHKSSLPCQMNPYEILWHFCQS